MQLLVSGLRKKVVFKKKSGCMAGSASHCKQHQNHQRTSEPTRTNPGHGCPASNPTTRTKVEIAVKFNGQSGGWRAYCANENSYLMCMGGGHDMCCNHAGHCWNYVGHDYRPPVSGSYGSASWKNWAGIDYSWNGRNEGDIHK